MDDATFGIDFTLLTLPWTGQLGHLSSLSEDADIGLVVDWQEGYERGMRYHNLRTCHR
jgi:hypothetical protein